MKKIPLGLRLKIFLLIFVLLWQIKPGLRAKVKKNISLICPDLTDKQRDEGIRRLLKTLVRSWAIFFENQPPDVGQKIYGMKELLRLHSAGRKIIVAGAHVGPIDEILMLMPSLFSLKLYVPVEKIRPAWFLKLISHLRSAKGDILLEPTGRKNVLAAASKQLESGRIVVLTIDVAGKNSGVICRLGNCQARFPVGAIKLALDERATMFTLLTSVTEEGKSGAIVIEPFELLKTGNAKADIELNVRRLIEGVYAPNIRQHWYGWLRLFWIDLEPADIRPAEKP